MQDIQRENTNQEKQSWTFTIIVDEDVATYIEQEGITDTNEYMNKLLYDEKQRQLGIVGNTRISDNQDIEELTYSAPDTSGYPEIKGHFSSGGSST